MPFFTKIIWLLFYYAIALVAFHGWENLFGSFDQFEEQIMIAGFYTWLVVVALASNFFFVLIYIRSKAIEFTDYFMVSKRQYLRMNLFFKTIQSIIYYLPAFFCCTVFAGNSWLTFVGIFGAGFCLCGSCQSNSLGIPKAMGQWLAHRLATSHIYADFSVALRLIASTDYSNYDIRVGTFGVLSDCRHWLFFTT